MQLTNTEMEQACRLNERIASCTDFASLREDAMARIASFFHADSSMVMRAPNGFENGRRSEIMARNAIQTSHIDIYMQEFCGLDPYIAFARDVEGPVQVFGRADCREKDKSKVDQFEREFLRFTGIEDILCFTGSACAAQGQVAFGLHRSPESPLFSGRDFLKARLIAPVVSAVLSRCLLEHAMSLRTKIKMAAQREDRALFVALVFDHRGRLIDANNSFRELSERDVRSLYEKVECHIADASTSFTEDRDFKMELYRPDHPAADSCGLVALDGRITQEANEPSQTSYLVTLALSRRARMRQRAEAIGLSLREKEILCEVCRGKDNKTVARKLAISPKTVENHVTSILLKARVHNRTELVASLSPQ